MAKRGRFLAVTRCRPGASTDAGRRRASNYSARGNEVLERLRAAPQAPRVSKPHAVESDRRSERTFREMGLKTGWASTALGLNHKLRVCCKTRRVWQDAQRGRAEGAHQMDRWLTGCARHCRDPAGPRAHGRR